MSEISGILRKLALVFRHKRFRSELDEEMAFYRAQAQQDLESQGMPGVEARRAAARQFGNPVRLRERSQEVIDFVSKPSFRIFVSPCARYGIRRGSRWRWCLPWR